MLHFLSSFSAFLGLAHAAQYLNLTSITAKDGISIIECWQLSTPFEEVSGTQALALGDTERASYYSIPPRTDTGLHNGPAKQYVWVVTGQAHVSVPNATDQVDIYGGKYGLFYVDDTADVSDLGHYATYPSDKETVLVMIPVKNAINPAHTVLHRGPCTA